MRRLVIAAVMWGTGVVAEGAREMPVEAFLAECTADGTAIAVCSGDWNRGLARGDFVALPTADEDLRWHQRVQECMEFVITRERTEEECIQFLREFDAQRFIPDSGDGPAPDHWALSTETDIMTDVARLLAIVDSPSATSCRQPARLVLRCDNGTTAMYVSHGCYAPPTARNSLLTVQWRVDDGDVEDRDFQTSTNDQAFGDFTGGQILIRGLFGAERLIVRFSPYRDPPVTIIFDVSGIDLAVRDLREACGW